MSNVEHLEKRIDQLEIQVRSLAAFGVETRARGASHRLLPANQVHGGENVEGFPTEKQLDLTREAALKQLENVFDRTELAMIDFGDEKTVM